MLNLPPYLRRPAPLLARLLVQCALVLALLCLVTEAVAYAQPKPDPSATPLQGIVALFASHGWLPLFALGLLYARKLCGPDSKFPITIPATWLPTVSAFFGLAYGVVTSLVNGSAIGPALLLCAVAAGGSGFLDGALTAIFNHGAAPRWAQAIVFLFDDLTGGATNATKAGQAAKAAAPAATGPAAPETSTAAAKVAGGALSALLVVLGLGAIVETQTGCPQAVNAIVPGLVFAECVAAKYLQEPAGTPMPTVLLDEVQACGGDAVSVVRVLNISEAPALHATVAHGGK